MRKQLSKIIFILIISLFIHPLISYSQEGMTEEGIKTRREPLKGIKGVYVFIEDLPPDAKKLGITRESLKTEVELKLRLAGIKIPRRIKDSPFGILSVSLNVIGQNNIYIFNIDIEFKEIVYIKRINQRRPLTIWEYGYVGLTPKASNSFIREELKRGLDKFLNDYLAVNPKKQII